MWKVSPKLKLLIGGGQHKFFHLREFGENLTKFGVEYKLVVDTDVCNGFPSRNVLQWFNPYGKFNKLVKEFKPNAVFVDRQLHFGIAALKAKLPLFVHLRGDYWSELKWTKNNRSPKSRAILWFRYRIAEQCFRGATAILPFSNYLSEIVKSHYPNKPIEIFHQGIDASQWYPMSGMNLKHPCVGLLQNAMIWGKAKEMLILAKIMKAMPNVTFYWAGDGPYREEILSELSKYTNFKWLGSLQYPDQVRQFLTEIDIYALVSGIDMSPLTLQEAQLMEKPVVATNVGGIPELMRNNETGFLVEKQNPDEIIEKISTLVNNDDKRKQMGILGRSFIEKNFNWEIIAKRFSDILNSYLDKN